jgi:hypothetical protein
MGAVFLSRLGAARTVAQRLFDGTRGQRAIFLCNEVIRGFAASPASFPLSDQSERMP